MSDKKEQLERYNHFIFRKRRMLLIAVIAVAAAAVFSMGCGSMKIPVREIFRVLAGAGESKFHTAIMNIRLPRVLSAVLVGAVLASSGAVMQCVLRNPLASASTLGVSREQLSELLSALSYLEEARSLLLQQRQRYR